MDPAFPPPPLHDGPSEAAKLLPPAGSSLRSLCSGYDDYTYSPLDYTKNEIRIVEIQHRASADSPIYCKVMTTTILMASECNFKALSYTWGPPTSNEILVDGNRFVIRDNLYEFLFLESADPECENRWYWIDQLCIDQSNLKERNNQVSKMSDVYRSARGGVTIWLGVGTEESDWAMDRIREPPVIDPYETDFEPYQEYKSIGDLRAFRHYPLYALTIIARCDYWQRVWIIQEVVLGRSPSIRFGSKQITLSQLDSFKNKCNRVAFCAQPKRETASVLFPQEVWSVKIDEVVIAGPEIRSLLFLRYEHNRERPPGMEEEMMLNWTRLLASLEQILPTAQCQEPRDRIFGMLGIVDREVRIEVDYAKSKEEIAGQVLKTQLLNYLILENRFEVQSWRKDEFRDFAKTLAAMLGIPNWLETARSIIDAKDWNSWI